MRFQLLRQWIQYLHAMGLLHAAFRPDIEVRAVRSPTRRRDDPVGMGSAPNVQVQHVISDITGVTGLAIVDAILAGERDTAVLAKLRDRRIKADEETIGARVESAFPAGGEWLTSRPDTDGPLSPANEGQAGAGRRNHSDGS